MFFVSGFDLSVEQSCSPPIPLMVRSAKIMAGLAEMARLKALSPSETTWESKPLRCSTSEMSRATWGSSSTTRIMRLSPRSKVEPHMHALPRVTERRAGQRAQPVGHHVRERRHPRGQKLLPDQEAGRKRHRADDRHAIGP